MTRSGWFGEDRDDDDLLKGLGSDASGSRLRDDNSSGPDFTAAREAARSAASRVKAIDWQELFDRAKSAPRPAKIAAIAAIFLIAASVVVPRAWSALDARMNPPESAVTDYYAYLASGNVNEVLALARDLSSVDLKSPFLTDQAVAAAQTDFKVDSIAIESTQANDTYQSDGEGTALPEIEYLQGLIQTNVGRDSYEGIVTRQDSGWKLGAITTNLQSSTADGSVLMNGIPMPAYTQIFPGKYKFTIDDPARTLTVVIDGVQAQDSALVVIAPGGDHFIEFSTSFSTESLDAAKSLALTAAQDCAKTLSYLNQASSCGLSGSLNVPSGATNIVVTPGEPLVNEPNLNEDGSITYPIELPVRSTYEYTGYYDTTPQQSGADTVLTADIAVGFDGGAPVLLSE